MATEAKIDYAINDADQHYYEPIDAFTRHLDPAQRAAIHWVTSPNGHKHMLVNGKAFTWVHNPTFNLVPKPGALLQYMKAENTSGSTGKDIAGELEPARLEYSDRDARVKVMDQQQLGTTLMLPTMSLGLEEMLWDDPAALKAVIRAGIRWVDEDWGIARDDRIISAPMLSLVDIDAAEADLKWVIDKGGKAIVLRPGPVMTPQGGRSPGDPIHDRFFALAAEAGVVICYHASDSGYDRFAEDFGEKSSISTFATSPFVEALSLHLERPISDTISALICHGAFDRHPKLKVAAIELGAGWVPDVLRRLATAYGRIPQTFGKDPVEAFHQHVWVTPFHEQSIPDLLNVMRPERVLFGSDWPHPEGVGDPIDFAHEVATLSPYVQKRIMADNLAEMLSAP